MASVENQILFISYIILAAVIAMVYGLRRIFILEKKIVRLEKRLMGAHGLKTRTVRKSTSRKKTTKRKTARRKTKRRR